MRPIDVIGRLCREGWIERQGKGSHLIFRKNGKRVDIAQHPGDIPTGTLREICRQAEWEWPTTRHYIAVAEKAPGEEMWSILFPDFPGVTSTGSDFPDMPQQARDALATAVEDMIAEGEKLPASVEEGGRAEVDPTSSANAHVLIGAAEIPEASTKETAASAPVS